MSYKDTAINKLKEEAKAFKGDKYEQVMYKDISEVLINFCGQDDEFAQCIAESDSKSFKECMKAVREKVNGNSGVRDLTAFKAAVSYYFDGADIECSMRITKMGDLPHITMTSSAPEHAGPSSINLSFDDLF